MSQTRQSCISCLRITPSYAFLLFAVFFFSPNFTTREIRISHRNFQIMVILFNFPLIFSAKNWLYHVIFLCFVSVSLILDSLGEIIASIMFGGAVLVGFTIVFFRTGLKSQVCAIFMYALVLLVFIFGFIEDTLYKTILESQNSFFMYLEFFSLMIFCVSFCLIFKDIIVLFITFIYVSLLVITQYNQFLINGCQVSLILLFLIFFLQEVQVLK